jgi:hypothetical protein
LHIELAEYLRCPADHDEQSYCVVVPDVMDGRDVRSGFVGCPICKREYPIVDGEARFGSDERVDATTSAALQIPAADMMQALLGIAGPGGYVVLVGSAAQMAQQLADLMSGIHMIAVNPPPGVRSSPTVSVLRSDVRIPLNCAVARGIVLGAECAPSPWLDDAVRVVLRGLRMIVLREDVTVAGAAMMVREQGLWVGVKEGGQ